MKPALITLDLKSLLQAVTIVSLFSNDYRFGVKCSKPITVLNLIELSRSEIDSHMLTHSLQAIPSRMTVYTRPLLKNSQSIP